jgi:hypothetical protein
MKDRAAEARPVPSCAFAVAAATGLAIVLGGMWLIPEPANATPGYASQTRLACGRCHVSPAGGGARTAFGNAFAANGHKVPSKGKKDGAAKSSKGGAGTTVTTVTTGVVAPASCGYYSLACNPRYGSVPEFGYSNALMFKLYPQGD